MCLSPWVGKKAAPVRMPDQLHMNAKALRTLEFDKVRERLAGYTSFSAGRALALALDASPVRAEVEWRLATTSEARRLAELRPGYSIRGAHDVRPDASSAALGAVLYAEALLNVQRTLETAAQAQEVIVRHRADLPLLAEIVADVDSCPIVQRAVRESISEQCEIRDGASPDLRRIRGQLRTAHQRLWDGLERVIQSATLRHMLQEPIITTRGGRYVVPVKADYRTVFKGLVHDQSASGATVFMEPLATLDLNNQWRRLQLEEQQEIERILRHLSGLVGQAAERIAAAVGALAQVDLALAKAHYAAALRAEAPRLDQGYRIDLVGARHPLLTGDVVPIDIDLGVPSPRPTTKEFFALVITGPNTGGKTVALKTVGLLQLMAQAGLHIPAAVGSVVSVFDDVFADIGDEQSLEQSLSTFSSHMTTIVDTLRRANERCLVLLDELGAGTDPAEGSALARAILSFLVARRVPTVATTHYSELKAFAYVHPGVQNAMVEFDLQTLAPTYKLVIGLPGRSNALAIAERLGLGADVLAEARSMLTPAETAVEDLLSAIQAERAASEDERRRAAVERAAAEQARVELQARVQQIEEEREGALERAQDEAQALLRQAQVQVRRATGEARRAADRTAAGELAKALATAAREVAARTSPRRTVKSVRLPPEVGDRVRVRRLEAVGEVVGTPNERGEIDVQLGGLRTRVPAAELTKVGGPEDRAAPTSHRTPAPPALPAPLIRLPEVPAAQIEIDLRGRRAAEVGPELERHLDEAYRAGLPVVRVIHGKGTGALRQVVHEHLAGHPLVESYDLADRFTGGDGATLAKLAL